MMNVLQYTGFFFTVLGYAICVERVPLYGWWSPRLAGAFFSLIGVTALGVWAIADEAWGVLGLEITFVLINLHVLWKGERS